MHTCFAPSGLSPSYKKGLNHKSVSDDIHAATRSGLKQQLGPKQSDVFPLVGSRRCRWVPACAGGACIVPACMVPFQTKGRTASEPVSSRSCGRRIASVVPLFGQPGTFTRYCPETLGGGFDGYIALFVGMRGQNLPIRTPAGGWV